MPEDFADHAYTADGTLVPRTAPGAVLTDPAEIAQRAAHMVLTHQVETIDGSIVPTDAESIYVHGASPDAVAMATAVRDALVNAGIDLAPFADRG